MNQNQNAERDAARSSPPVFPMGFRIGFGKEICIVDLLDRTNNEVGDRYCFYSFALTKNQATELMSRLKDFVGEE